MRKLAKLRYPRAMFLMVWIAELKPSAGPLEIGCQNQARMPCKRPAEYLRTDLESDLTVRATTRTAA